MAQLMTVLVPETFSFSIFYEFVISTFLSDISQLNMTVPLGLTMTSLNFFASHIYLFSLERQTKDLTLICEAIKLTNFIKHSL